MNHTEMSPAMWTRRRVVKAVLEMVVNSKEACKDDRKIRSWSILIKTFFDRD
jgi:hypothetical protein